MLQVINSDEQFYKYVKAIPSLTPEEELELTTRYYERREPFIAEKIVMANLKNVLYMCFNYRGYGLPIVDMFQEGSIGLMKALDKFEPSKGFRFMTFATIWVKSEICNYVIDNISIVRQIITKAERKLFFNFRQLRYDNNKNTVKSISKILEIDENIVKEFAVSIEKINDVSLNVEANTDGSETFQDHLVQEDNTDDIEYQAKLKFVYEEVKNLDVRTRDIIIRRHLTKENATLDILSKEYGLSKERIRQIEEAGFKKIKERVQYASI